MWVREVRTVAGLSSRSTISSPVCAQPPNVVSGADNRRSWASLRLTSRWVRAGTWRRGLPPSVLRPRLSEPCHPAGAAGTPAGPRRHGCADRHPCDRNARDCRIVTVGDWSWSHPSRRPVIEPWCCPATCGWRCRNTVGLKTPGEPRRAKGGDLRPNEDRLTAAAGGSSPPTAAGRSIRTATGPGMVATDDGPALPARCRPTPVRGGSTARVLLRGQAQ
jgi:hypothetical protein